MRMRLLVTGVLAGMLVVGSAPAAVEHAVAAPMRELTPLVTTMTHYDTSAPLSELAAPQMVASNRPLTNLFAEKGAERLTTDAAELEEADPYEDRTIYSPRMPSPIGGWQGIAAVDSGNWIPPDPNGDVGLNHYVQTVNTAPQIWDKSGNSLLGPVPNNTLFVDFGGPCEETNDGDPIVLYDPLADRWFFSQFALPDFPYAPFYQCLAVSATADPTGAWHRYEYLYPNGLFNDYPKFGVWNDGYYMTANQFLNPGGFVAWAGTGALAFERAKMLDGEAAQVIYFDLGPNDWGGMLPSDVDGKSPPDGTPNYFAEVQDRAWDPSNIPEDRIQLWAFAADWENPAQSTFTNIANLKSGNFNGTLCGFSRNCVPQKGTFQRLDTVSGNTMYRLQYRKFKNHASLVTNLTVKAGGGRAGVRWYEIRITNGVPTIYQQGTYIPDDELWRWMASAAMDRKKNLAIGFSASSENKYPMINYAGRMKNDPLNTLAQGEARLKRGKGSQTSSTHRWGDYTMLAVDPADNCTFWYTNEYYSETSDRSWKTWIGTFKFDNCN